LAKLSARGQESECIIERERDRIGAFRQRRVGDASATYWPKRPSSRRTGLPVTGFRRFLQRRLRLTPAPAAAVFLFFKQRDGAV